jgi:hypothetical protein
MQFLKVEFVGQANGLHILKLIFLIWIRRRRVEGEFKLWESIMEHRSFKRPSAVWDRDRKSRAVVLDMVRPDLKEWCQQSVPTKNKGIPSKKETWAMPKFSDKRQLHHDLNLRNRGAR